MKSSATQTARFAVVVRECGQPEPVFLWTKPEDNRDLMSAIRHNRVMTLKQETRGTRKDFGEIGFVQERNASYLIFPKPLTKFQGRRIVGVNYDLIKIPGPMGRVVKPREREPSRSRITRGHGSAPRGRPDTFEPETPARDKRHTFRVSIRFTAVADVLKDISARSAKIAREQALKQTAAPDFSRATVTKRIQKAERVN
jgi:hypothetical protein